MDDEKRRPHSVLGVVVLCRRRAGKRRVRLVLASRTPPAASGSLSYFAYFAEAFEKASGPPETGEAGGPVRAVRAPRERLVHLGWGGSIGSIGRVHV